MLCMKLNVTQLQINCMSKQKPNFLKFILFCKTVFYRFLCGVFVGIGAIYLGQKSCGQMYFEVYCEILHTKHSDLRCFYGFFLKTQHALDTAFFNTLLVRTRKTAREKAFTCYNKKL